MKVKFLVPDAQLFQQAREWQAAREVRTSRAPISMGELLSEGGCWA
jgi:hypothetical protein